MRLKEKFKQWLDTEPREQIREVQLEEIADEFAIGFADWVTLKYPNQRKFLLKQGNLIGFYTTKELLEIYKTEQNL